MTNLDKNVVDARDKQKQLEKTMKLDSENFSKFKNDIEIFTGFDIVDLDKKAYEI